MAQLPRFDINRGKRRGCPLSPFLFLLVAQVMAVHMKNDPFQHISALGKEFKLVDDTINFWLTEIASVFKSIEEFSQKSLVGRK